MSDSPNGVVPAASENYQPAHSHLQAVLQRGRFAAIDSDYKPLDPAELAKLREGIDESYKQFVTKVAESRLLA